MHADAHSCFDDLGTAARLEALRRQIDQVAAFLADYHARVYGAPSRSVLAPTVIEICSTRLGPEPLYWSGPNTLEIRMPAEPIREAAPGDGVVSAAGMAQAWRRGAHHVEEVQLFTRPVSLRRVWPVVDPAGLVRTGLRKLIVRRARELQARLETAEASLERLGSRGADPSLVRVSARALIEAETGLPTGRVRRLMAGREPAALVRAWRAAAGDPGRLNAIAEEVGADVRPCSPHRGTEERKRLLGLVVVENVHDIYVCVGPSQAPVEEAAAGDGPALKRDLIAVGLVVVSTADVVHVEASLEDEIRELIERMRSVARGTLLSAVGGAPAPEAGGPDDGTEDWRDDAPERGDPVFGRSVTREDTAVPDPGHG
jgi:hypothetical protein